MNNEINFRELREKLSVEDIKRILAQQGVEPVRETEDCLKK